MKLIRRPTKGLVSLAATAFAVAGCSLVIDTDGSYDDIPDAARPDLALDGGAPDAAPLDLDLGPDISVPLPDMGPDAAPDAGEPAPYACRVPGLAGGLWTPGQDPREGVGYGEAQARARLEIVARATDAVRLYSGRFDGEAACIAKQSFGLHVTLGAWIDADAASNREELDAAVMAASFGCVDELLVGNEVLLRGDLHADALAALIQETRDRVPDGVRVGTADTWDQLVAHRRVIEASDVVYIHAHSYWAGQPVDSAVAYARAAHARVAAVAGDREVVLGEVGLPTAGDANQRAVPGNDAASRLLVEMTTWAEESGVRVFWFAAFDEGWKDEPGGVGPHWGVFDEWGMLKAGLQPAFECARDLPDLPALPPTICRPPAPTGDQLVSAGGFAAGCDAWTPGWVPEQSGADCIDDPEHDRRDGASPAGLHLYTTADEPAIAGPFAWREQRMPFTGGWTAAASAWVRDGSLERGHAFLHVVFENDQGQPVGGDEVVLTGDEHAEQGAEWVQLRATVGPAPCETTWARVRIGVRKTERGAPAVTASVDDVSLTAQ